MKKLRFVFISVFFIFAVCICTDFATGAAVSQDKMKTDTRPILDDIGFCWKAEQVNRLMDYLAELETLQDKKKEKKNNSKSKPNTNLVAAISPHDDYLYSGRINYPLFKHIRTKEVVVFGVTHRTVRNRIGDPTEKIIFDNYRYWQGPFKKVTISPLREFLKKKLNTDSYLVSNEAHALEHSVEAMIPFLQYFNRDIKITPIMVTGMDFAAMDALSEKLAGHIADYITENNLKIGKDIFFLVSADANHYGKDFKNTVFGEDLKAHQQGTEQDKKIIAQCLEGAVGKEKLKNLTGQLWGENFKEYSNTVWCGKFSIPFGMLTTLKTINRFHQKKTLEGELIRYSDTYSEGVLPIKKPGYGITAPFSLKHWVGFFTVGFYLQ